MHRRFTTMVVGRDGALRCCLITDTCWHLVRRAHTDPILVIRLYLGDVLALKVVQLSLLQMVFHAHTLQSSYHKTVKVQSLVTTQVPSNKLTFASNLVSLEKDNIDTWVISEQKLLQLLHPKQFISVARLCFSLEFPLCVDIKCILVHSLKSFL